MKPNNETINPYKIDFLDIFNSYQKEEKEGFNQAYFQKLFQNTEYKKTLQNIILKASTETFEQLCSMKPLASNEKRENKYPFEIACRINFLGPFVGTMCFVLYGSLVHKILLGMLGGIEVPSSDLEHDAFGEFANIIAGNILPAISSSKNILTMTPPTILTEEGLTHMKTRRGISSVSIPFEDGIFESQNFVKDIVLE